MAILFGGFGQPDLRWSRSLADDMPPLSRALSYHEVSDEDHGASVAVGQHSDFFPLAEPVVASEADRIFALQGYLWAEDGFPTVKHLAQRALSAAGNLLLDSGEIRLPTSWGGLFNIVAMDLRADRLLIANDPSGLMPLYYGRTVDGGILFASHSAPLARSLASSLDTRALVQQCCFHYTIGSRSLFQGVNRLKPGETLEFVRKSGQLRLTQQICAYSAIDRYTSEDEAVEALWADYLSGAEQLCRPQGPNGVLLSGGLDTRLIVVALKHFDKQIQSVTFGDPGSFEVAIAQQVADLAQADRIVQDPAPDCQLTESRIDRLIARVESVNFAYCESGALGLRDRGAISGTTGYGGETFFGGQGFYMLGGRFSGSARLLRALTRSARLSTNFQTPLDSGSLRQLLDALCTYHSSQMAPFHRRFSSPWRTVLTDSHNEMRDEIRAELERMCESGPDTVEQLCERFHLEHHVLGHFGRQELTVDSVLPLAMPTLHHSFFTRCSNLPPGWKVDHGLYLKLVKRHWGAYADIPTANIPISLGHPVPALWLARGLRAVSEKFRPRLANFGGSGAVLGGRRTGWADFETWMRQGTFLDDSQRWIDPQIIDPSWLNQKILKLKRCDERIYSGQDLLTWITVSRLARSGVR